jgi:hypothetical protein
MAEHRNDQMIDMERARREELRWMILVALNAAQPVGTSEYIIREAVRPVLPDITHNELRCALSYLEERKLISVNFKETPVWFAKINWYGIDMVEHTIDCLPGIARPRKW